MHLSICMYSICVYFATGCSSWSADRIHVPLRLNIACPVSLVKST